MKNPIQVFDKIKDSFILYVKTAFSTRYPVFEQEREALLNQDKIFARSPWVEPLPIYKPSDYKISEIDSIANLNDEELKVFKDIASKGLVGDFKIYQHQYEMLTKAMEGKHCVITSGTGSGKTESFLLPLFAYLSKELNKWKTKSNTVNNTKWWNERGWGPVRIVGNGNTTLSSETKQRPNPQRPAAIRAMLIYPMNALVEDQLSRLRKALDSDKLRELLVTEYNDNRIYFGRYNSTSPVPGKAYKIDENGDIVPNKYKIQQLKKELNLIEGNIRQLDEYIAQNLDNLSESEIIDLKANFQQLDGAEMRTRFDMQQTPPDIMISNFSMLSIMLMRECEESVFEKTKAWLECNTEFDTELTEEEKFREKKERVFHLIIDELHLYRGGSGSEIAYLVRLLLQRLGLTPDSNQLRILASSASLEGDEGKAFLKSFFGTEEKEIQIIQGVEENPGSVETIAPLEKYVSDFALVGKNAEILEEKLPNTIENINEIDSEIKKLTSTLEVGLFRILVNQNRNGSYCNSQIKEALYSAFTINDRVRAVPAFKNGSEDDTHGAKFISEVLFGVKEKENKYAIKGFFFLLGLLDKYKINHEYPRLRFHLFYRNIAGMWGELISDNDSKIKGVPIGQMLTSPKISHNNHRTLELLYCENCGTIAFGGSRVKYKDEEENFFTELLPVSPDIEGVPETSPATIVEKRKYNDFSVFIPGNYENIDPEHPIPNSGGLRYRWYPAWLNIHSGRIVTSNPNDENKFITGKWLRVKNGDNDIADIESNIAKSISCLPPVCPHCESDYSHPMKKKQSPLRGFRTGFGKMNQILSKELFESLPDGEKTKKLVAFSDSREDAAKLSKSIQEEHYLSLLKEVVVFNLTKDLQYENKVIEAIENSNEEQKLALKSQNESRYIELGQLWQQANGEFATSNDKNKYNAIKENIKSTPDFVSIIIKNMLKFGINPAGPYKSVENVFHDGDWKAWYEFFDFDNYTFDNTKSGFINVRNQRLPFNDGIREMIEQNLSSFIFGRLYFSFEASGLGFATVFNNEYLEQNANRIGLPKETLLELCNSFIRIWGDNYKHNRTDFQANPYDSYSSLPQNRKERRYVRKVARQFNKDEETLGDIIFQVLQHNGHRGIIEIQNLNIKVANDETAYYKCENCGTIHLHTSAGYCVFCLRPLNKIVAGVAKELWSTNYLTANLNKTYSPFRLHTEELTGQTDDQLLRQRQFKNIFLNPEEKLTQQIDLLSVTTTLEVGVDIGALQAILLANMPPQRFNYQQRVGRTGRRGQLFSYSLTFARGRSHDEYYFENPISITGDKPPQPFLSLDQARIFKRMFAKAILRFCFKLLNRNDGSVHGEFGTVSSFNEQELRSIIENNTISIQNIFNALNAGIYSNGILKKFQFDEFSTWINELPTEIASLIQSQRATNDADLSELLAEAGILPMAGMPTRIRNLIHGFKPIKGDNNSNEGYEALSVDRDLSMAIYEFAPGAQKTKDKGVVQAIGFTPNIKGIEKVQRRGQETTFRAQVMHDDAFSDRKWLIQDNITKVIKSEAYNDSTKVTDEERIIRENPACSVYIGASPSAFRTDYKFPKDSNEDFEIVISKPLTFAETTNEPSIRVDGNLKICYAQQELTWKINNNGGNQFVGQYVNQTKHFTTFENQWITSNFINPQLGDIQRLGSEETISLASCKVTEVFRIEPKQLHLSLNINPFETSDLFKASSSKGAFYSAAFLLQRTLADDLDIDPEEIEIAAIDSIELPEVNGITGRKSASIVLVDELPNGSGFIEQLYSNFDKYAKKCINPDKLDNYNYSIITNQECMDSSYTDLKNYRNMNFHPLLDWRLGVGLIRVLCSENYQSGLTDDDYDFPELKNWLSFAKALGENMEKDFDNIEAKTFGKLHGFCISDIYNVIIVHPFWNYTTHQPNEESNVLTSAMEIAGLENLFFIDTFNLHRRPGWCYGELVKQIISAQ